MIVGKRLLALRSGKYVIWAHRSGTESAAELRRRWRVRRDAERVEVLTAHGGRRFSASVYAVGEPRCLFQDPHLWTVRETNARAVFLGSENHPHYALCLVSTKGRILRQIVLPGPLGREWFLPWRAERGPDGFVHVSRGTTPLFRYQGTRLVFEKPKKSVPGVLGASAEPCPLTPKTLSKS